MSPCDWDGAASLVFYVYGSSGPGFLNDNNVSHSLYGVRPEISLNIQKVHSNTIVEPTKEKQILFSALNKQKIETLK